MDTAAEICEMRVEAKGPGLEKRASSIPQIKESRGDSTRVTKSSGYMKRSPPSWNDAPLAVQQLFFEYNNRLHFVHEEPGSKSIGRAALLTAAIIAAAYYESCEPGKRQCDCERNIPG